MALKLRLIFLGLVALFLICVNAKPTTTTVNEDEETAVAEEETTTTTTRTTRTTRTITPKTTTTTTAEEETAAEEVVETTTTEVVQTNNVEKTSTTAVTLTAQEETPTNEIMPTPTPAESLAAPVVPLWIPPPPPPHPAMPSTQIKPCSVNNCPVAVVGFGKCAMSLEDAIYWVPDGGVVEIGGDITATAEISLSKSVELRSCGSTKHKITVDMNVTEGALLRQLGDFVNVSFTNLHFQMKPNGTASVLRTMELQGVVLPNTNGSGTAPIEPPEGYKTVDVYIQGCTFTGFKTKARGGSVVFVGGTRWFTVVDSEFSFNVVHENGERYEGGGAIWIRSAQGWMYTFNNTRFFNNSHEFPHGTGGAIGVNFLSQGYFELHDSLFRGNHASGGGALAMGSIEQYARVHIATTTFEYNAAIEYGWGSRGGVAWLQNINGTVRIDGTFFNNTAAWDRGACFANNMLRNNGSIVLGGTYTGNYAGKGGTVWDTLGSIGFSGKANFTVLASAEFSENESNGTDRLIRLVRGRSNENELLNQADWENEMVYFEV